MRLKALLFALLTLVVAVSAFAQTFTTSYIGFDDIDGDGKLSCGEPVTIRVFYRTDSPSSGPVDPTELHGQITMPDVGTQGVTDFQTGSVTVDPLGTDGCSANIIEGNGSGDPIARVGVTCATDPMIYPNGATLALTYKVIYYSRTTPQFIDTATFAFVDRPTGPNDHLTARDVQPTSSTCSGPPTDLTIAKSSMGGAVPGQAHVYLLRVGNATNLPLGGIYARETVPASTRYDPTNSSPGWFCSAGGAPGSPCTYFFSALNPGSSTVTFGVLVDSAIPPGVNNITNTACVAEVQTVAACSTVSDSFASPPSITVTKSIIGGTPAIPGGNVSFDVAVSSTGSRGSEDVVVTDTIPPGMTFNASGSSSWTCGANSCQAQTGALAVGQTKHLSLVLTVPSPLPAGGANYVNNACGTPAEGGNPVCSSVSFGASGTPVLNVRKVLAQGDGTPGTDLGFDLTIRNDGDQDAGNVMLGETVPANTAADLANSELGWSCSGSSCGFAIGGLAAGAQRTVRFTVTIQNPLPAGVTSIVNTACPTSQGAVTACDTITIKPKGQVVLTVAKTLLPNAAKRVTKVLSGVELVYSVSVTNAGNQDAADVTLTETVPAYTTYDSSASDPWVCASGGAAGSSCSLEIGPLAAGSTASRRFAVRVGNPPPNTDIRNTACAEDGPTTATGCGEVTTPPDSPTTIAAQLSATQSQDNDSSGDVTPGDVLLFTVILKNTGTAPAGSVQWMVNPPDHSKLVPGSVSTSAGSISAGNAPTDTHVAVDLGNVDPAVSVTISYRVTIDPALPASVTELVSQGDAMSSTAPAVLSDDPSTPEPNDPTIVKVRHLVTPPPPHPTDVPTLGELGLIALALALGACALRLLRRRASASA